MGLLWPRTYSGHRSSSWRRSSRSWSCGVARCGSGDERGEETRWEFSSHLLPHPMGAVWGQKLQCNFGCGVLGWFFTPRHTSEKPKMLHGEVLPTDGLDKKGGDWQSRARTWLHPHVGGGGWRPSPWSRRWGTSSCPGRCRWRGRRPPSAPRTRRPSAGRCR